MTEPYAPRPPAVVYSPASHTDVSQRLVGWLAFAVLVAAGALLAVYVPVRRREVVGLLRDFKVVLPKSTQLVTDVPDWGIYAVVGTVVGVGLLAHLLVSNKLTAAVVQLVLTLILVLVYLFCTEAVNDAMRSLTTSVNGQ